MIIRQATLKDLNLILEFMGRRQIRRNDWHIKSKNFIKSYIKNKHNFFFICIDNKSIVGSIAGELWDDKGFAYVGEIVVKGKNKEIIINEMFNKFIKFCRNKKINLINAYVNNSNKKQVMVYKSLGMKKKGNYFYFEKRI